MASFQFRDATPVAARSRSSTMGTPSALPVFPTVVEHQQQRPHQISQQQQQQPSPALPAATALPEGSEPLPAVAGAPSQPASGFNTPARAESPTPDDDEPTLGGEASPSVTAAAADASAASPSKATGGNAHFFQSGTYFLSYFSIQANEKACPNPKRAGGGAARTTSSSSSRSTSACQRPAVKFKSRDSISDSSYRCQIRTGNMWTRSPESVSA